MKRCGTAVLFLLVALPGVARAQGFWWTISNSPTTALSNSGPLGPGPTAATSNLYLWLYCSGVYGGLSAAEFDVVESTGTPGATPMTFTPTNGFLNAGTASALLLSHASGCTLYRDHLIAGVFTLGADSSVPQAELCLGPSSITGRLATIDCLTGNDYWTNWYEGFRKGAGPRCALPACGDCCIGPLPVEGTSWGDLKALYR